MLPQNFLIIPKFAQNMIGEKEKCISISYEKKLVNNTVFCSYKNPMKETYWLQADTSRGSLSTFQIENGGTKKINAPILVIVMLNDFGNLVCQMDDTQNSRIINKSE